MFDKDWRNATRFRELLKYIHAYLKNEIVVFSKIGREDVRYSGTVDFFNQSSDEFLEALAHANVNYIDLRDNVAKLGVVQHRLFYRTDHHWLAETGFWAAGEIVKYFKECGVLIGDDSMLREDYFEKRIYRDWFLGSYGRKVTLARAKPDDITLLYPKFETSIHYVIPGVLDKKGDWKLIYDMNQIVKKDYYNRSPYSTYNYGDRPLISIDNLLADNGMKILVLKDSFANCVTPFLALQFAHMDILDLRKFTGSVKTFVTMTKPDIVLMLYSFFGPGKVR